MPKQKSNDFYIVSLCKRKPFSKFWLCALLSIVAMVIVGIVSDTLTFAILRSFYIDLSVIITFSFLLGLIYLLFIIWRWYWKHGRNKRYPYPSAERLVYFLQANKLFETDYEESVDKTNKVVKEQIIVNSAVFGCFEDNEKLIVRAYKKADKFNDKMNDLDTGLSALFGLVIDNKIDSITHCDYIFKKISDKRIIVKSENEIEINGSVNLPLNNNLNWNVLKQPHLLLAGVTGSGKTTFLNYLIMGVLKNRDKCR